MTITLGDRIKELRIRKGLTQTDLGGGIVTPSMISQIEGNKSNPSFKVLGQIAEKLETTVEYLIADSLTTMETLSLYRIARASMLSHNYPAGVKAYEELLTKDFGISKLQLMTEYAECLVGVSHSQKAIEGLRKALDSVTDTDLLNHALLSRAFYTLGLAYLGVNNHVSAYHHLNRALMEHSLGDGQDSLFMATVYKSLADTVRHVNLREHEQYLNKALEQYGASDSKEVAGLYLELAQSHASKKDYTSSIEYSNRAISAYLHKGMVDECKDCERLLTMCEYRQKPSEYEKFIDRLLKIVAHFQHREDEKRAGILLDIATIFYEAKKDDKALQYVTEAKALTEDDHSLMGKVFTLLGFICIDRQETSEAKQHFYKAVDVFKRNDCLRELKQTVDALIDLLEQEGVYKEGLDVCRSFNEFLIQRLQVVRGVFL